MRNGKFDKVAVKGILKALDVSARKHGLPLARYAATKWVAVRRDQARLSKERAELEKKLAEVSRRLSR